MTSTFLSDLPWLLHVHCHSSSRHEALHRACQSWPFPRWDGWPSLPSRNFPSPSATISGRLLDWRRQKDRGVHPVTTHPIQHHLPGLHPCRLQQCYDWVRVLQHRPLHHGSPV
uniref:Uncharacterized protein n=1 Tax=uncultured marine virus TaxID=186617 RepID=A0A0F7L7Y2_9VIRU|nr:hypothetical protein [uncultured marine virus]